MSLEIQISSSLLLLLCIKHLQTNELFLQVECFLELFFPEIMPESWGCGLYTSAAYTRVFTVYSVPLDQILSTPGWSSASTFAKFYN